MGYMVVKYWLITTKEPQEINNIIEYNHDIVQGSFHGGGCLTSKQL